MEFTGVRGYTFDQTGLLLLIGISEDKGMKNILGRFIDIAVVGAAVAVGAGAIYNLSGNKKNSDATSISMEADGSNQNAGKGSVGRVVPLGKDVRHKGSAHEWTQVQDTQSVYELDRVYAGEGSRARVDLDSGGRLYVSPSSLVTISRLKEDEVAQVESGSLIGELLKGGRLLIKQKNKITELTGQGKVLIKKSAKGLQLEILHGSFDITKSNKTKRITEPSKVTIVEDVAANTGSESEMANHSLEEEIKIEPLPTVSLLNPSQGSSLWLKSAEFVAFKWQGAPVGKPVKFSMAYSPDFKTGLYSTQVNGDSYSMKINPMLQYYWKVESADREANPWQSSTGLFATWMKEGPKLVSPHSQAALLEKQKLSFNWNDQADSTDYLVEIARDHEFKNIIASQKQMATTWNPETEVPPGQYFWRVTSSHPQRESLQSEVGSFSVSKLQPVVLPALSLAGANLNFELYEKDNYDLARKLTGYHYTKEVNLSSPVGVKAKRYEWDVNSSSQGRSFSKIYSTALPELNDAELQVPSQYFVKVRYQNDADRWSEWSQAVSARVILAAPRLWVEQNKSRVHLKWTQMKNAPMYEFMTSKDAKFVGVVAKKADTSKYIYEDLEPGAYFSRVRALNASGWPTSSWSKPVSFDVAAPKVIASVPAPPVQLKPIIVSSPEKQKQILKKALDSRSVASISEEDSSSNIAPTAVKISNEEIKPKKVRNISLYSGIGTNYLKFNQKDSSGLESGNFSSVTSPTLMVEAGLQWDEKWKYSASFHQMPGTIMNNPSTTINQTDYKWSYLGVEAERKIYENIFGAQVSIMGGVQRHEMPFLIGGTNTDVELIQTQLTTGALGFHAEWRPQELWLLEAFMRYQVPLASGGGTGGVFKVTGGTSYDGLLGVSRRFFDNWKVGVYWFGQSHDLNYTFKSDDGSNDREGKQILFNSDLQVRVGYSWYFGHMIFAFRKRRKSKDELPVEEKSEQGEV